MSTSYPGYPSAAKPAQATARPVPDDQGDHSDGLTRVQIHLLGELLHLRGAAPAARIEQLAQEVDRRLQEAVNRYPGEPRLRVLLLVCLNLAEELAQSRQEAAQYRQMLEELTGPATPPPPAHP